MIFEFSLWQEMNCNQEILFLFSLVVVNNFNVHLIVGEKGMLSLFFLFMPEKI